MKTITLHNNGQEWMAQFNGDQGIIDLFGTDTLPTPFGASVPVERVKSVIANRNPGYNVIVA